MAGELFDLGPVYDPHLKSIMKLLLSRLKNKNPSTDSKVYMKNAAFVQEIYDGKFLHRQFDMTRKDFDYKDSFEKIRNCKGNWTEVRNVILTSLNNLDLSKKKEYLPFNKDYVNSISFSTFFECFNIKNHSQGMESHFLNYINPPIMLHTYAEKSTIVKLKKECLPSLVPVAEKISSRHFKDSDELSFWYNILDMSVWLRNFKNTFPDVYNEFIMNCEKGNPLEDFYKYLVSYLKSKHGDGIIVQSIYFKKNQIGYHRLGFQFLGWLRNGIERNKFSMLKNLPKSIDNYCDEDSFVIEKIKKEKKAEKVKEVVDFEDLPVF